MILMRYSKNRGAEYLSHLDLLRHVYRTLRRAGIAVKMSEGYNPHARIYLNNPLPVGVESVAEYAALDCVYTDNFKELFNSFSPEGIRCLGAVYAEKNPNYAFSITKCKYRAEGLPPFDAAEILGEKSIVVSDLRGREKDIRPLIYGLESNGGNTVFTLGCGQQNLRPDLMCLYLCSRYGGRAEKITKLESYGEGVF